MKALRTWMGVVAVGATLSMGLLSGCGAAGGGGSFYVGVTNREAKFERSKVGSLYVSNGVGMALVPPSRTPEADPEVPASFIQANGFTTEGVKIGPTGDMYLACAIFGPSNSGALRLPSFEFVSDPLLQEPQALGLDSKGNVYMACLGNQTIVKYDGSGFSAFASQLAFGLVCDSQDNLYAAFQGNIFKFTPQGVKTTFATGFTSVNDVTVDSADNLYVTDSDNTVKKVTPGGVVTTLSADTAIDGPRGIAHDATKNLYVLCQGASNKGAILQIDDTTGVTTPYVAKGNPLLDFQSYLAIY